MPIEELFRDFWWLMFPIFGMGMGLWGMASSERRSNRVMDLIKSYVDQGKDPPPELLKLATQEDDTYADAPQRRRENNGWSFTVFAALAVGFGVGWYLIRGESYSFAFLIVAVTMGVMALGALLILLTGRK